MKWLCYWGRLGPCLGRNRNEVSSWHTVGRKTSNHGWMRGWENRLKGETPVGGQWGVGLEVLGGERMEKALISAESTTKTVLFTLKRKGIAFSFFFSSTRCLSSRVSCPPWACRKWEAELGCSIWHIWGGWRSCILNTLQRFTGDQIY